LDVRLANNHAKRTLADEKFHTFTTHDYPIVRKKKEKNLKKSQGHT
jgi:hypothetical protein